MHGRKFCSTRGEKKGRTEGRAEIRDEMLISQREALARMLSARFPQQDFGEKIAAISDTDTLWQLIPECANVATASEAFAILAKAAQKP